MLSKGTSIILFLVLCFQYVPAASDCGPGPSHNFIFGKREKGDEMLFMDIPTYEGRFFRKTTAEVEYPIPGEKKEGYITYMEVLDQYKNGKGGCAYVRTGGVGQSSVVFFLESGRGEPMKFVIRVYGHKRHV